MPRNITDPVEKIVARALDFHAIDFLHESENKEQRLDFYLPKRDLFIECKQFHTDRIDDQVKGMTNVLIIQGMAAAKAFEDLLLAAA